jgi:hypothetical protein
MSIREKDQLVKIISEISVDYLTSKGLCPIFI